MNFKNRKGQGSTEYLLILAAVLVVVGFGVYYVTQVGNYPPLGVVPHVDQDTGSVWLYQTKGEAPAGGWEVELEIDSSSVASVTEPSYMDGDFAAGSSVTATGNVKLDNNLKIATITGNTSPVDVNVILRHIESDHTYLNDTVTVQA